jgi:hypothetical protein
VKKTVSRSTRHTWSPTTPSVDPAYLWSRDSKYILFVQDHGGDENYTSTP